MELPSSEPLTVEPPAVEPPAAEPAAVPPPTVEPSDVEPAVGEPDGGARAASIEAEPAGGRSWGWLAAALILGILVALGLFFLRSQQREETPSPASPEPAAVIEEPLLVPPPGGEEDATAEGVADGDVANEQQGGLAAATGIDIEQMVNEELSNRAERLRQDFEAEKKRIEEELARTRAAGSRPASEEEEDGGGENGSGS